MVARAKQDPLFGAWFVCLDGQAHYRLRGRALCGSGAALTSEPLRKRASADDFFGRVTKTFCPTCRKRNVARWAGVA